MDFQQFFLDYGLLILLGALLVFMFWSSSRRAKKQREQQAQKARETVPGAEVLLQGGIYGTIIEFDPDNLDEPAVVEIAPGIDIRVHSQAILRVVTPADEVEDAEDEDVADDEFDEIVDGFHESADAAPAASASDSGTAVSDSAATSDADGDADTRDGDAKPSA